MEPRDLVEPMAVVLAMGVAVVAVWAVQYEGEGAAVEDGELAADAPVLPLPPIPEPPPAPVSIAGGRGASPGAGRARNPVFGAGGGEIAFEVQLADRVELWWTNPDGGAPFRRAEVGDAPGSGATQATFARNHGWVVEHATWDRPHRLWMIGRTTGRPLFDAEVASGDLGEPAVDPNGRFVAFVRNVGELWLSDLHDGRAERLLDDGIRRRTPAFSPSGRKLAFTEDRAPDVGVGIYDLDARRASRAATGDGDHLRPTWVTEGRLVSFRDAGGGASYDIVLIGEEAQLLAEDVRVPSYAGPAVSPDRRWVAYVAARQEDGDAGVIWMTSTRGTEVRAVEVNAAEIDDLAFGLRAGRTLLAYTATSGGDHRDLYVVDVTEALR